jgi:hypothetical protein
MFSHQWLKNTIFLDVTLYSLVEVQWWFIPNECSISILRVKNMLSMQQVWNTEVAAC